LQLNTKSFDGPKVRPMRNHAGPIVGTFLITVVAVLWNLACKRDRIPEARDAAAKGNAEIRRDASICEEEIRVARRVFSNVVWNCIEGLERPRPAPYAMSIAMERTLDAGTGVAFSVQMHGPRDAVSIALEEEMVKCAVEEYRRCPASYDRALWRWKDAKRIQMGRPNRDILGPELE
jgi:hypothetical protein